MFWGLIMEPQRRYTQKVKKAFHISMAALDISAPSDEPAQIMVGFQGRNYLLCTLRKPDLLQCTLDLNFEVGDELSLAANGKCHVHLTGYLIEDANELLEEEESEVEEEEAEVKEVKKKDKKRIREEAKSGPPVKKSKANTTTAEESSDEDEVDVRTLLDGTLQSDSDEEDDSFGIDEEDAGEQSDDEDDEVEQEEDEDDSSLSESDSDEEEDQSDNKPKMNGSPKKQEIPTSNKKKEKKNKKNEQQKQKNDGKSATKENQSPKGKVATTKKTLQSGLIIEDLKEGQGQPAKPGKFVTVYYEGRLKSNNKMFDSTKQGQGFSFKLGGGEVIKGWDAGLVGMKIGGKRRIVCPPNMAYGAKGSPPAIPANSTLVFDVELRKIR